MAFGKKKENNLGHNLSEVAIRHNIRVSSPYGCYPEDVDKVLLKYEELVNNLQAETQKLDAELQKVKDEYKVVDDELRRLKFDMTLMDVPDTSAETDIAMIGRLSNINENVGTIEPEVPEIVEPRIPIDIIDNTSSDDLVFDDLITSSVKKDSVSTEQDNTDGVRDKFGRLEIL